MFAWSDQSHQPARYFHPRPEPAVPGKLRLYVGGYGVFSSNGAAYYIVDEQGGIVKAEWLVLSEVGSRWAQWRCRRRGEAALERILAPKGDQQHVVREVIMDHDAYIRHLEAQVGL